ncbi:6-phosphofructokinase [Clostridia bacterium]|nr:6-phosphofructokinase [Clostridia bacterium]
MNKIAVMTSGGDAPGMNPAIRAVVRKSVYHGLSVVGIKRGFEGLLNSDFEQMDVSSVGDIVTRGGTKLLSARCEEFLKEEVQIEAANTLRKHDIDGLIVIGGDGSFRGALALQKQGIKVVGVPGTIDNDIAGTEMTIGFDTAVNTALEAISKLRDTATSHERLFLVEVMGRHCGAIALATGIAGGAEAILIPEMPIDYDKLTASILRGKARGKISSIIVVAEGATHVADVEKLLKERTGANVRTVILGHLQRGGSPTVSDSILASRMGAAAVDFLREGKNGVMTALLQGNIEAVPLEDCLNKSSSFDEKLYHLAEILAI